MNRVLYKVHHRKANFYIHNRILGFGSYENDTNIANLFSRDKRVGRWERGEGVGVEYFFINFDTPVKNFKHGFWGKILQGTKVFIINFCINPIISEMNAKNTVFWIFKLDPSLKKISKIF